jgi:hypothetical protein
VKRGLEGVLSGRRVGLSVQDAGRDINLTAVRLILYGIRQESIT